MADTTYYFDRLVTRFRPKAVVVYSGSNDIHGFNASSKTGEEVARDVAALFEKSREALPGRPFYYISISPNLARWKVWPEAKKANALIQAWGRGRDGFVFIDAASALLGADGKPRKELFLSDGLHFSAEGYRVWTSIIRPILLAGLKAE